MIPSVPDPKDDMVLELAVASQARYIVTFNGKHFAAVERFGAEKMSALMTEDYLEALAQQGDRVAFDRVLAKVPARPADPWDRWDVE
jgi:predicted nucleic acid-binding protein